MYEDAQLLQVLNFMPLTIRQAASYIEQRALRLAISRYLDKDCRSDYNRTSLLEKDVVDG